MRAANGAVPGQIPDDPPKRFVDGNYPTLRRFAYSGLLAVSKAFVPFVNRAGGDHFESYWVLPAAERAAKKSSAGSAPNGTRRKDTTSMTPRIWVVSTSMNQCKTLRATLRSIVSQDFKPYEIVVIDGGSRRISQSKSLRSFSSIFIFGAANLTEVKPPES